MAASLSAIKVTFENPTQGAVVRPELCLISMALSFINRHRDVFNTMGIALTFWFLDSYLYCNSARVLIMKITMVTTVTLNPAQAHGISNLQNHD